jgi:hypothetical protein
MRILRLVANETTAFVPPTLRGNRGKSEQAAQDQLWPARKKKEDDTTRIRAAAANEEGEDSTSSGSGEEKLTASWARDHYTIHPIGSLLKRES